MPADVPAAELDYVQIDRKLVECAVEALDSAKKANLKVLTRRIVYRRSYRDYSKRGARGG